MASFDASGKIIDIETDFDYIVYCLNADGQSIMERVIIILLFSPGLFHDHIDKDIHGIGVVLLPAGNLVQ